MYRDRRDRYALDKNVGAKTRQEFLSFVKGLATHTYLKILCALLFDDDTLLQLLRRIHLPRLFGLFQGCELDLVLQKCPAGDAIFGVSLAPKAIPPRKQNFVIGCISDLLRFQVDISQVS